MPLNASTTNKIIDILLPYMGKQDTRRALVETALPNCRVLYQIQWEGAAKDFTRQLVQNLLNFKQCNLDQLAIVSVLKELQQDVGTDVQNQIDALIRQIEQEEQAPAGEESNKQVHERSDRTSVRQVWVPPGRFLMGSDHSIDRDAEEDEFPQHEVYISRGFWMDMHSVTNAAYQQFIADGGYRNKNLWTAEGWAWLQVNSILAPRSTRNFNDPQQPRVGVSWYEADAYARWRDGRLPTEAEWEYAARGPHSLLYPWGDTYDSKRLNIENRQHITAVVGKYVGDKSWVGAYDMAGNVLEWVADWYSVEFYKQSPSRNPRGPDSGWTRVLRGGSWRSKAMMARAANRHSRHPEFSHSHIGFRIVCDED